MYTINIHYPCNYVTHVIFNTNLLNNTAKFETSTIKLSGSSYTILQCVAFLALL